MTTDELTPLSAGAVAGAIAGALIAQPIRPLFPIPSGAVGYITVHHYPKDWDLAVIALIVAGALAGALIAARRTPPAAMSEPRRPRWLATAIVVFVLACIVHDLPNAQLDFFHEGEHLTPAFLLQSGGRPYRDVYLYHGFFSDGVLDLAVIGNPPSVVHVRRLLTILGAATLALLAPIAAELCATSSGVAVATFASLCAAGFGELRLFNYYRLAPLLIATLGLLRYIRTKRAAPLFIAMIASTAGVLWSLDVGMFALTGTIVLVVAIHAARLRSLSWTRLIAVVAAAALVPTVILVLAHAGLRQFFADSFISIPKVAWLVWSLPQPAAPHLRDAAFWLADEPARYYVPLVLYGLALAIAVRAWKRGAHADAARIATVVTFALLLFRSAAGRVDPNHTRFALPLSGIVAVALVVEQLAIRGRRIGTIVAALLFVLVLDVVPNVTGTVDRLRTWPVAHRRDGLVDVGGMLMTPSVAADVASLRQYSATFAPDAQILDASNSMAVYFLLRRKAPVRNLEVMMWAAPEVFREEMPRLRAHPPAFVVLDGYAESAFDGLALADRVPELARWIDANYPRRLRFGRFIVAAR